jgi:hypothetical protein
VRKKWRQKLIGETEVGKERGRKRAKKRDGKPGLDCQGKERQSGQEKVE